MERKQAIEIVAGFIHDQHCNLDHEARGGQGACEWYFSWTDNTGSDEYTEAERLLRTFDWNVDEVCAYLTSS